MTDVSSHGMTLRVDDTFGSFGVREGDEIFVGPDGTVGDRYFVVVDVNSRPQRLRVDGAGLVHLCGGYERIPVERAASIALASNCYEEAKKEGLMAECPDGSGCSSGSGGPAVLTAGAVAALFAALRSRRRMIP
ncbi:hypothetical protein AKJ08_0472 [Vulgatibacter incomptus]|uniref:Uncharacterized protein n=1 Tax=Vulgatibacter incomptus TaxID=1391653 RepID=A0A0K1P989_9BACT|nr:hypothetical protein AKJ08_0472 [Vulgatibacter incomptus]